MTSFDEVIIGSGTAGCRLALEMAKKGHKVLILERGDEVEVSKAHLYYDIVSTTGVELWRVIGVGGSALVSLGNADTPLIEEIKALGIDISHEAEEIKRELKPSAVSSSFLGERAKLLIEAAKELKLSCQTVYKFVKLDTCRQCGRCAGGCPIDNKWTPLHDLQKAKGHGAKLISNFRLSSITRHGEGLSVKGLVNGVEKRFSADKVIVSAGALETPRILKKAGLTHSGKKLFADVFITVGGPFHGKRFRDEIPMTFCIKLNQEIALFPHISSFLIPYLASKGVIVAKDELVGVMVKIADDSYGKVGKHIEKSLTTSDLEKLERGKKVAMDILAAVGVKEREVVATHPRGVHLGGSAAIGDVVNREMETEISGLYVCDGSVLPKAPGAPPIMTILALAKKLAKKLCEV